MILPAYFIGFSSRSDGSASLRFATQEVSPEQFAEFKRVHGAFGWLAFQENPVQPEDIPTESAEDKDKTPSKRLRAVMYVFWKQLGEQGDFEVYYREKMEAIIEKVKTKLD